jgi:hypothetical protein
MGAGYVGTKHHRRNPTHTLRMYLGVALVRTWQPQEEKIFTKILPGNGDVTLDTPPF